MSDDDRPDPPAPVAWTAPGAPAAPAAPGPASASAAPAIVSPAPPVSPPPPSAPAEAGHPTAAPPKPRLRWVVVLVAALVLIAAAAVGGTVLFATRTWPPLAATYDFTNDLEHGHYSSAYNQICAADQAAVSRSEFTASATKLVAGAKTIDVDIFSVDRKGSSATTKFTVHPSGGSSRTYTLRVIEERGDWKPCGSR